MAAFSVDRPAAARPAPRDRVGAVHGRALHLRPVARLRRRAALPRARAAADPRRDRALRQADPDRVAAAPPLARRAPPALVGLRDLVHLPDALLRDAHRRGGPLDVGARALRALRDDGVRPRAHRVRDLRALPGGAAVARGAARAISARRNRTIGIVWHARADRALRLALREGPALREQRRGDAVAARGVRAADRALSLAARAALGAPAARALSAGDGVRARLLAASTTSSTASPAGLYAIATFVAVELRLRAARAARTRLEPAFAD